MTPCVMLFILIPVGKQVFLKLLHSVTAVHALVLGQTFQYVVAFERFT